MSDIESRAGVYRNVEGPLYDPAYAPEGRKHPETPGGGCRGRHETFQTTFQGL